MIRQHNGTDRLLETISAQFGRLSDQAREASARLRDLIDRLPEARAIRYRQCARGRYWNRRTGAAVRQ